jgi:hypothetical protein
MHSREEGRMKGLRALAIGCLILASGACATTPSRVPPSVDVTGTWSGTWEFVPVSAGTGTVSMTLTQKGAEVSGPIQVVGPTLHRPTRLEGVVIGERIQVTGPIGDGWLTVSGDQMTGELNGFLPVKLTARRQR